MWRVGTKRLLGIFSGPSVSHDRLSPDQEHPEFPPNVRQDAALSTATSRFARSHRNILAPCAPFASNPQRISSSTDPF